MSQFVPLVAKTGLATPMAATGRRRQEPGSRPSSTGPSSSAGSWPRRDSPSSPNRLSRDTPSEPSVSSLWHSRLTWTQRRRAPPRLASRWPVAPTASAGSVALSEIDPAVKLAERESLKTSERLRRTLADRARNGQTHGSRRCFGYKAGNMEIDEAEAFILREMGGKLLAGCSFKEIAYWANEQGYKTAEGKMWYSVTIRNSLRRVRALMARRSVIILVGRYGLSITVECKATHSENAAAVAW
jgi:hypothetical protein